MSEVAEMFDVNQSLIRYWESKFDCLRPKKNKKGNRMFRPEDIEHFKVIYHLVKECGMTLDGAKRAMKQHGADEVSRNAELLERLQSVRAMLVEVREILKDGDKGTILDDEMPEGFEFEPAPEDAEPEEESPAESAAPEKKPRKKSAVEVIEPKQTRKRKKRDDDQRPLFAFYEQTLF